MKKRTIILAAAAVLTAGMLFGAEPEKVRIEFDKLNSKGIPEGWVYKGKLGARDVRYEIEKDAQTGKNVLKITCDKASGTILYDASKIDFKKYPVMRWKWKVQNLSEGADGRVDGKDDQGIAIYLGSGRFRQVSVAYRWETETPKGFTGKATYGGGLVKVNWWSVRNKEDGLNQWLVDECEAPAELLKALNEKVMPESNVALSVSSNSQYTGTRTVSYLEYIEFVPAKTPGR